MSVKAALMRAEPVNASAAATRCVSYLTQKDPVLC
jgi:hypothetical protein